LRTLPESSTPDVAGYGEGMTDSVLGASGVDVALRDGSTIRIRATHPGDFDAVRAFLAGLSERSRWLRFFGGAPNLNHAVRLAVTPGASVSLVAVAGTDGHVVAHGTY